MLQRLWNEDVSIPAGVFGRDQALVLAGRAATES